MDRFRAADTQVLGVSIDSVFSHANWGAKDLGGVSFPLLADFEPKGAVAKSFGHYLGEAGITDRSTVIIDKSGVVQFSKSYTPGGERDISELAAECERINAGQAAGSMPNGSAVPGGTKLFVKSSCGASRKALLALDNLHLHNQISVSNVTESADAANELSGHGNNQAPCLVMNGAPTWEAADIAKTLADMTAPV